MLLTPLGARNIGMMAGLAVAIHNRIQVKVGDRLYTKAGEKTRWTVIGEARITCGKTYALLRCDCSNEKTIRLAQVFRGLSNGCQACGGRDISQWPKVGARLGGYQVLAISTPLGGTKIKGECIYCGTVVWRALSYLHAAVQNGRDAACKNCRPHRQMKPDFLGRHIQSRTKYDHPELNLSIESLKRIMKDNCFYCGGAPANVIQRQRKTLPNEIIYYQGIDEVVHGKGHVAGNILPCCIICNKAKSNHSVEEFCLWYNRISKRTQSPEQLLFAAKTYFSTRTLSPSHD